MAGREYSGIEHAVTTLFEKASMILVPLTSNVSKLDWLKKFYLSVGFGEVVFTTAEHHDSMIAYTSQLCHIVSNAFIKNQSAEKHCGYSAGSYRDLTRVARLNGKMWTELMMDNRDMLSKELDELIFHLTEYKNALQENDENKLLDLLESGNNRKLKIDSRKKSNDNPDG
jgi:prephenate dehydrogenase